MTESVFRVTSQVPFYETDRHGDVRLPYLLSLALTVSGQHSQALGLSDTSLFEDYGLFWAVTNHHLTINRLPLAQEVFTVKTSIKSYNRFVAYRVFEFESQTGEVLMTILTSLVLVDYQTRKMVKLPADLMKPFEDLFAKKALPLPKLKSLELYDEKACPIRYFDLDANGHVNNSRYLEWVYDGLTLDFIDQHRPAEVEIFYRREISPSQNVVSRTWLEQEISQHDFVADGQVSAQVQIRWQKRQEKGKTDV